jgi:hypothetical protein
MNLKGGYIGLLITMLLAMVMLVWLVKHYYLPQRGANGQIEQESVIDYAQRTVDNASSR